jgi:hypothetical protein
VPVPDMTAERHFPSPANDLHSPRNQDDSWAISPDSASSIPSIPFQPYRASFSAFHVVFVNLSILAIIDFTIPKLPKYDGSLRR